MSEHNISGTHPFDEKQRLAELHSLDILNTPPEERFDRYTRLVAEIFKVPMAMVSLIDEDHSGSSRPSGWRCVKRLLRNRFASMPSSMICSRSPMPWKTIANKISRPIEVDEKTIRPDIGVGISVSPDDGTTPEDLLDMARAALKFPHSHEGLHIFSHEAEESAVRRHWVEQRLEPAFLADHLVQHYQPLVLADGSRIVGFEALALLNRWPPDIG